jgi:hypothetical protein
MSTPIERIQSGTAIQINPSGMPDENDSNVTDAVRHERNARPRARMPLTFTGSAIGAMILPNSGAVHAGHL